MTTEVAVATGVAIVAMTEIETDRRETAGAAGAELMTPSAHRLLVRNRTL